MSRKYSRRARLWVAAHARAGAIEQRLSRARDGFPFAIFAGEAQAHYDVIQASPVTAGDEPLGTTAGTHDVSAAALAIVAE
jgi:hypothetical protein